jgi:hypothetical protein
MRKHAVVPRRGLSRIVFTLAALEVAGLMLSAFFWFVMRPDLLASYGPAAPAAVRVALSLWFVPMTSFAGAILLVLGLVPTFRTRTRTWLAGTALVATVFGLTIAVWAAYAPAFETLGP